MSTPSPAPDPTAATDVPASRAKLPPLREEGRDWFRRGRAAEPSELELVPSVPPAPERAAVPAEVVEALEEEPTDHGPPTPGPPRVRPYADLPYEERLCRLLEDIRENTRLTSLRLGQLEHKQRLEDASTLDLQPSPQDEPQSLPWRVLAWAFDPRLKAVVGKALAVGTAVGGSMVASGSTMALVMELLERLLRAWVELP